MRSAQHRLLQEDFRHLMRNLPVPVADEDIDQMFDYADTDKDGRLSYKEFQVSHTFQVSHMFHVIHMFQVSHMFPV